MNQAALILRAAFIFNVFGDGSSRRGTVLRRGGRFFAEGDGSPRRGTVLRGGGRFFAEGDGSPRRRTVPGHVDQRLTKEEIPKIVMSAARSVNSSRVRPWGSEIQEVRIERIPEAANCA